MTTDRAYRKARPADEAVAELRRCSGTHFDPAVVEALAAAVGASRRSVAMIAVRCMCSWSWLCGE